MSCRYVLIFNCARADTSKRIESKERGKGRREGRRGERRGGRSTESSAAKSKAKTKPKTKHKSLIVSVSVGQTAHSTMKKAYPVPQIRNESVSPFSITSDLSNATLYH